MNPVVFDSTGYRIGGVSTPLISGEFHYFRVPKADWRRRMRLFKETGGNTLSTYIPWLLHEPEEGRFAWGGDGLDLEGFLQVAREEGLYVIARPGPYQYSELIYDGLPGWLCENYPEVLARNPEGQILRKASISYVHPLFWDKVRRWFDAVCPILARYCLTPSGGSGPIAFIQIDNEMGGVHEWFGGLDYNPVSMGFGQSDGRYPLWLQARYSDIRTLNTQYGTRYASFAEVEPCGGQGVCVIRRRKDYFHFYLGTIAAYARFLTDQVRAHHIQTPIVHNSAHPNMNTYFLETVAELGDGFLLGSDHYYNLGQTWPQNNPTPQYAVRCLLSLEELRLMGFPPTVFELPGGSCADWPPLTPSDALASYMTNLAFGMKGFNYYIFTGGQNPPAAGAMSDMYDYSAAISPTGEIRPLLAAQKAFGQAITERPWLATAERVCDFRMGLDLEYARALKYWPDEEPRPTPKEAWEAMRAGPLTTALCLGLSPEMVRLDAPLGARLPGRGTKPLLVVAACSMAARKQQAIVNELNAGGHALILPVLPWLDDHLNPCTILSDYLGAPTFNPPPKSPLRPRVAGVANVLGNVAALWERLPPGAEILGMEERSGKPLAWSWTTPGGGTVIVLGLSWQHSMREQEQMLKNLLVRLGCEPAVHGSNPNVWVTVWTAGHKAVIFLLNLLSAPMETAVSVTLPDGRLLDLGRHRLDPVSVTLIDRDV
ncbi:MAG: hypothetical protein FJ222_11225 [Lentisphaerae bacterium]|nr:hypothetical protein [Lentisphaerota bacterium]